LDNSSNAYFRIVALSSSSGSGSRDTIAIDNFSITAVPEPHEYALGIAALLGGIILIRRHRSVKTLLRPKEEASVQVSQYRHIESPLDASLRENCQIQIIGTDFIKA
jgi:hypothetical protein